MTNNRAGTLEITGSRDYHMVLRGLLLFIAAVVMRISKSCYETKTIATSTLEVR